MSFQVLGLQALQDQLLEIGAELGQKTLAAASRRAFAQVIERAKGLVPVDSGALRDALRLRVVKPKGGDTMVVVGMYVAATKGNGKELPPARRWHFVELGTVHMPAHPFARPALDATAGSVLEDLKTELAAAIQRAMKRKARAAAKAAL